MQPKEISKLPFGERLKVIAEVTERSTGTKEQAIDQSIKIVETPFSLSFDKTAKYFKPGINLNVGVLFFDIFNAASNPQQFSHEYSFVLESNENHFQFAIFVLNLFGIKGIWIKIYQCKQCSIIRVRLLP